ncbi:MAG TPA: tRNA uridine-5-carboxymethylaminomethyl(34) synthesis enzyme MnmG [Bacteroidetes bacterium]|nr:tRNA uridine-5-carboxymethylaminomethyl(34) synthesis enzyme MnmG [Bacteroidota bacterium]
MFPKYDVIVVGAGHSGCEAAVAAANLGSKVMLVTMNMQTIAQMSCNPAMGGVAKGQIVREIDALGGYSGIVTDHTMVQFRMLNRSKGPAMWSPRAQSDRMLFAAKWRKMLEEHPNVDFWQEMVTGIIVKDGRARGVRTGMGIEIESETVVLTNGTFLNGLIHIGEKQFGGGRAGERAAKGITEQLRDLGFESGRMKTGTPPRVDGRSLDWDKMELQEGDTPAGKFSYTDTPKLEKQLPCHIAYTSPEVHEILRTGFDRSPMFNGRIQGQGPRYCPSIEDKIDRFAGRDRHQLFVEPEGWDTCEIYVNGFSSSLPEDVQLKALRKIEGFEKAKMFRPGYAIEYDYFPPHQLQLSLETHLVKNLFFAGQINGTTGYEEAGCQGLMAGINAHLKVREQEPFILKRSEAYIGVLIDDLVNKGTKEPYRMFTSRAEYRILLRQDNADIRLTPLIHAVHSRQSTVWSAAGTPNSRGGSPQWAGVPFEESILKERIERVNAKKAAAAEITNFFKTHSVAPDAINGFLASKNSAPLKQQVKLHGVLLRPNIGINDLRGCLPQADEFLKKYEQEHLNEAEINMKYEGYIRKEQEMVDKMNRLEEVRIIEGFDFHKLNAISSEAREKLTQVKPRTIGQASRISGVTPADVSVLLVHMGR